MKLNFNIYKGLSEIDRSNLKSIYGLQHRLVKGYRDAPGNFVPS